MKQKLKNKELYCIFLTFFPFCRCIIDIWGKNTYCSTPIIFFNEKRTTFFGIFNYKVLFPEPLSCYRHLKYSYG